MASNPMQRKARNSFLLGMLLMLIISGAVIAILFMQLIGQSNKAKEESGEMKKVYMLTQDVKSGQVITEGMLSLKEVYSNYIPQNAIGDKNKLDGLKLQDKEGNEVYKTENDGNTEKLYIKKGNQDLVYIKESESDNYYKEGTENNKEYIELDSVPLVAKVDMRKNTIVTSELVTKSDNNTSQDDVRKQEYNMLVLPADLATGDYIDVRVLFPNGQDYVVVSKKEVEIPNVNGTDSEDTIWINLSEDETLHMSCAIIDAFQIDGTKLYVSKYTEAGMQKAATANYPIRRETYLVLNSDPNILDKAKQEIASRYNSTNGTTLRNDYINSQITDKAQDNLKTNMEESITNSQNTRKKYLDSLASSATTSTSGNTTSGGNTTTNSSKSNTSKK